MIRESCFCRKRTGWPTMQCRKVDGAGRRETEEEALIRALIEREVVTSERPAGDGSRRNFLVAKQREKAQRRNLAAL